MRVLARAAIEWLAAAVAPPRCAACDAPVPSRVAFCRPCASSAVRLDAGPGEGRPRDVSWSNGFAAFAYGGAVARAILRLKYEERPDLARPLGDLVASALTSSGRPPADAVVVPVPLHPSRLAARGYNHAALIGARIASVARLPFAPRALARARDTPPQARLDARGRRVNVAGAFVARRAAALRGRAVVLVDDVRTTGATLEACVEALLSAGVSGAGYAVVAQAEHAS